jgi:hypothetical protein
MWTIDPGIVTSVIDEIIVESTMNTLYVVDDDSLHRDEHHAGDRPITRE